jgi:uncharacterized protein YcgL (UPF0745 family)
MSYKRPEDKQQFINHFRYLLNLTARQRLNREDWQEVVRLLKERGNWKRAYHKR